MELVQWLIIISVILHGIMAGISFDVALVKLPTRKRIGPKAYAEFARGNDLGNGLIFYPVLGILVLLLAFGTTVTAYLFRFGPTLMIPLYSVCFFTAAHTFCTVKAAPVMLSLKNTADDEAALRRKLDRFAFWHAFRAVFQLLAFLAFVWALIRILKP